MLIVTSIGVGSGGRAYIYKMYDENASDWRLISALDNNGSTTVSTRQFLPIASNKGIVPELVCERVKSEECFRYGYDARNNQYGNLIEKGIIDPTLVVTSALRHAVSAADNLLSVSCSLTVSDL